VLYPTATSTQPSLLGSPIEVMPPENNWAFPWGDVALAGSARIVNVWLDNRFTPNVELYARAVDYQACP